MFIMKATSKYFKAQNQRETRKTSELWRRRRWIIWDRLRRVPQSIWHECLHCWATGKSDPFCLETSDMLFSPPSASALLSSWNSYPFIWKAIPVKRGCCTCSFSSAPTTLSKVSSAAAGAKSPICRAFETLKLLEFTSSFQLFQPCMSQQKDEILRSRPLSDIVLHPQLLQSFCTHQPWRTIAPAGWTS